MQKEFWSKEEKDLARSVFTEENLYKIRDVFYQFTDKRDVKWTYETLRIIRKVFLMGLDPETPLIMQRDLFFALNSKDLSPDIAVVQIMAKDLAEKYIEERIGVLEGKEAMMKLTDLREAGDKTPENRLVEMEAYQFIAGSHIPSCLTQLEILARPEETEEEKKERLKKSSNK